MSESQSESLARQGGSFKYAAFIVLLALSIILIGVILVLLERRDRINNEYIQLTTEQQLLSRGIVTQALESSRGITEAFDRLKQSRDRFDAILTSQKNSLQDGLLTPSPAVLSTTRELESKWQQIRARVDVILAGKEAVLSVSNFVPLLEGLMPRLVDLCDQVATSLTATNATPKQVYTVTRQLLLGQRLESNLNRMLTGGTGAATAADDFERDLTRFGAILRGMNSGDTRLGVEPVNMPGITAKLTEINNLFSTIEKQAGLIRENSPVLFQVRSATQTIASQGDALLESSSQLLSQYKASATNGIKLFGLEVDHKYAYGLGLLALGLVFLLVWETNRATKLRLAESEQRKRETEEQNRRNQDAILRLLDELGDLAEGDLTVQASVTEDITGAIADSVNYAIEALRDLVSTINNTSELVASAAQETRAVADRLARASEVQARQIESSSKTVLQMAQFMDEVSANTASSAEVAEKSVNTAHEGGDRVRRTIQGMDAIREHIQETSKRMKRLGESSQEIGDIVALINDITDQTNILALNAAIQASAAGEAGRGFAVVADEVQRLAERSSNATKRIEALVKTIQADTNEAIISMEKSTTEVVNGAGLAEKAGEALEEIETVSGRLAALINDVSKAASQVTEMASRVSTAMISINEITAQTSESSLATASSIGKLNQLAQELRQSVAGFRLPEQALGSN